MDVLLRHPRSLPFPPTAPHANLFQPPNPTFFTSPSRPNISHASPLSQHAPEMKSLTRPLSRHCCRHPASTTASAAILPAGTASPLPNNCSAATLLATPRARRHASPTDQQARRGFISFSSLFTPSSESTTKTHEVSDAEVYTLAQQKQHLLSLADLIKSVSLCQLGNFLRIYSLTIAGLDMAALLSPKSHSSAPPTSHSPSSPSAWHTASKPCAISPTSSFQIPTSLVSTAITSIHSLSYSHTGNKPPRAAP